eukprot:scaffold3290_cov165-Ochromonas_danica.AAC.7
MINYPTSSLKQYAACIGRWGSQNEVELTVCWHQVVERSVSSVILTVFCVMKANTNETMKRHVLNSAKKIINMDSLVRFIK